jgi:hypothetical protein
MVITVYTIEEFILRVTSAGLEPATNCKRTVSVESIDSTYLSQEHRELFNSPAIGAHITPTSNDNVFLPMGSNRNYKQGMVFLTVIIYQPSYSEEDASWKKTELPVKDNPCYQQGR